jgi:hypothetical protein
MEERVMGLIILVVLVLALAIGISVIITVIKLLLSGAIGIKELIFGLFVSVIIFGFIVLSYKVEGNIWALSPVFRVPFLMVYLPYAIHLVICFVYILIERRLNVEITYFSKILLISISFSVVLSPLFLSAIDFFIAFLNIEMSY